MNQYLEFKKDGRSYTINKFIEGISPINLLFYFLCGDTGPSYDWTIFFLQNPEKHNMSFNYCHIYKEDQEHVVLSSLYEEEPDKREIHCTAEQLVKLIEDWKKAIEQEPEYIYVSQKTTGDFIVTTSDANA